MKIPMSIFVAMLGAGLGVMVGLEAWTLNAVVDLKTDVAALKMLVNQKTDLAKK